MNQRSVNGLGNSCVKVKENHIQGTKPACYGDSTNPEIMTPRYHQPWTVVSALYADSVHLKQVNLCEISCHFKPAFSSQPPPPQNGLKLGLLKATSHKFQGRRDGVVVCLLCSERFFAKYSGFPLSSKTTTSKFQFDLECSNIHEPMDHGS